MATISRDIHATLIKNKLTLAVAESCTGGLLSKLLTDAPGSSAFFLLGVVAYSNAAKSRVLGIPASIIKKHGAVSAQTARRMAHAVRTIGKADCGIGITGIAGPQGALPRKPIGTVFIAAEYKHHAICKKFHFPGPRAAIRAKAAHSALGILQGLLKEH